MNYFINTCIMEWVSPNHMSNYLGQSQPQVTPQESL